MSWRDIGKNTSEALSTKSTQSTEFGGEGNSVDIVDIVDGISKVKTCRPDEPTPVASVDEIRAEAGEDWDYIVAEPDRLAAFVRLVAITKARQEGKTPDHYAARTVCKRCEEVPIFEGAPANVEGCPWCRGSK